MFGRKKERIVVREYQGFTHKKSKAFEKDARKMLEKGYRIADQHFQRHTILGVHTGMGTLVVTYELDS